MNTRIIFVLLSIVFATGAFGQNSSLNLTFSAINGAAYTRLDSIRVMNRTQSGIAVLHWPDTVLTLNYNMGIPGERYDMADVRVFQNIPNPMQDQALIKTYIPGKGQVKFYVRDVQGRQVAEANYMLEKGLHSFRFSSSGESFYLFTAKWNDRVSSIKILGLPLQTLQAVSLDYLGKEDPGSPMHVSSPFQNIPFSPGDALLYICYSNSRQSGILDNPATNKAAIFQFATNIPCPGAATVT